MIRAEVCKDAVAQAGDGTVVLECDFDVADLTTPVNRRLHVLASRFDPLDGFAKLHRNPSQQRLFGVDIQLRSKAAADLRSNYAQLVFGKADHERDLSAHEVRY